jgi:hydroxypyruvate reductase
MTTKDPFNSTNHLRHDLAQIGKKAIAAVDPVTCLKQAVVMKDDHLIIEDQSFDLAQVQRIIVVGFGKASARMAAALEGILGERISCGLVVTADGYAVPTERVTIVCATHPIPDERGMAAAEQIAALVDGAGEKDLVIVLISGGGSALLVLPASGITLDDLSSVNGLLLRSGARIQEMNTVRKHLSQVQGGQLAQRAFPAQVIALILSDVPGDPVDVIASGPTVADPTTFQQVKQILCRHNIWDKVPHAVLARIKAGLSGEISETPKPGDPTLQRVSTTIIGSGTRAAEVALAEGIRLGYNTLLLTTTLEGEARVVGKVLASLAREEVVHQRPLPLPALIIAAGETTVTVIGDGKGGRNQELALAAALGIEGLPGVVFCSLGTDGCDGPTDAAGGIVDGGTTARIRKHGADPDDLLARNDAYHALSCSEDLIIIGPTGTNVADICMIAVEAG